MSVAKISETVLSSRSQNTRPRWKQHQGHGLGGMLALLVFTALVFSPVANAQFSCDPVEVVFIMDTSGSMSAEAAALCTAISGVQADLGAMGITATSHLLGISVTAGGSFGCLTDNVAALLGGTVPGDDGTCDGFLNQSESWGQAIAVTADGFPWMPTAVRVIIPLSDEGPCNGNTCSDPGADRDAADNGAAVAVANGVLVSPITGTGSNACVLTLAADVATATNGMHLTSTDPGLDIAQSIIDIIVSACLASQTFTLDPPLAFNTPPFTTHMVTAKIVDSAPAPLAGALVTFLVTAGPNLGATDTDTTDANGEATFTYASNGVVGVDVIEASFLDTVTPAPPDCGDNTKDPDEECDGTDDGQCPGQCQVNCTCPRASNSVKKFWDEDCQPNAIPDTCDIDCGGFGGACGAFPSSCGQSADGDGNDIPDDCARCGDDAVNQPGEECDGTDDAMCPGLCHPPGHPNECGCPSHYQCYESDQRPRYAGLSGLTLDDQFSSADVELRRRKRFCNPANKNDEDPTAVDDAEHLTGYTLRHASRFQRIKKVQVSNQFGDLSVEVVRPTLLLVPTAKDLTMPLPPLVNPAVDHFQCYRIKRARQRVRGVKVVDQFGELTVDVKKPVRLCAPVDKNGEGILDPRVHMVCYSVRATPQRQYSGIPFWISNQLEETSIAITRPTELCVPSVKVVP